MKTGEIGITMTLFLPLHFLVYGGLMMLNHLLICEFTAVVLHEQDLMEVQHPLQNYC